jgi:predicted nucleic acid-binding protein
MLIYLDLCCYNRPFDEQESLVIRLETEAKLFIQELIKTRKIDLVWSFVLDYENANNPFDEQREQIQEWQQFAIVDVDMSSEIEKRAEALMTLGLHQMDASHIACAITAKAKYFITADKQILNKMFQKLR